MPEYKFKAGKKGKRNVERVDISEINDNFVVDFPMSATQMKIIEIVYSMRAVKMSQLFDILGHSPENTYKHVLPLYLNRFLERINPSKDPHEPGTKETYLLLDQAGAIFISGYLGISMKEVKWERRDNLIKYDKLNHCFEVCNIRAQLEKMARKKGHKVLECVSDKHLFIQYEHKEKKHVFRPDLYFKYVDDKKQYSYFVEVDMGTMAIMGHSQKTDAFADKVVNYERYKLSGEWKYHYGVYPRVLVITTTTERAEKLMEAVKEKQQTSVEFLFTSFTLWNERPDGPIFIGTDFDDKKGNFKSMFI